MTDYTPTQAKFLVFIRDTMGIPSAALPDNSPTITLAYGISIATVNLGFSQVAPIIYEQMVYYLGGSVILNMAPNIPGAPTLEVNGVEYPYFTALRIQYGINSFVAGVIQSAGDEGTNESMLVPDFFKNLTLANLQQLKDPYGRQYLAWAQSSGSLWGIT